MKKAIRFLIILCWMGSIATVAVAEDNLLAKQPTDIMLGSETAPVTIIEYFSLSCPHCAAFHKDVFPTIDEKYIGNGKVRFIARPYVTDQASLMGAQLLQCVPHDKYYPFIKVLLAMQQKWAFSTDVKGNLKTIAGVGGVSAATFDACLADKTKEDAALKIRQQAEKTLKITGVPTLFINDIQAKGGADVEKLGKTIEELLASDAAKATKKH